MHSRDGLIVDRSFNYQQEIASSALATANLLHITAETKPAVVKARLAETQDEELRQDSRTIASVHARTLLTRGRIGLVQLLLGKDAERTTPAAVTRQIIATQEDFGPNGAYGFALLGNQPNLVADISAHAARANMLQGDRTARLKATHWLARGLFWTMGQPHGGQEGHARNVLREFRPYVASPKQAAESVRLHP